MSIIVEMSFVEIDIKCFLELKLIPEKFFENSEFSGRMVWSG
jgi:hypothetical protein